jgi:hypothetical protein
MANQDQIEVSIDQLKAVAENASIEYNKGEVNYAFVTGYLLSSFSHLLEGLDLSKKQLKALETHLN